MYFYSNIRVVVSNGNRVSWLIRGKFVRTVGWGLDAPQMKELDKDDFCNLRSRETQCEGVWGYNSD